MRNEKVETKFQEKVYEKYSVKWYFFHKILEIVAFFYKNSIKPSTYSIRIFTKDLELQLSKKCTNRIYYFSVSPSTSSSSSLSFLYFFSFLHIFTCFEALPPEFFIFLHNKSQFRPLLAWIIHGRQTHLLEKKYIRQYVTLWLVDFPRQKWTIYYFLQL